ncbi:hypothetical protein D3C75_971340 [compost metagenome]
MVAFGQDQTIDVIRKQRRQPLFFTLRQIAVVRQHGLIVVCIGNAFDTPQHFGKYLVGQRRQQHADRPAGRIGKDIRGAIGNVAKFVQRYRNFLL